MKKTTHLFFLTLLFGTQITYALEETLESKVAELLDAPEAISSQNMTCAAGAISLSRWKEIVATVWDGVDYPVETAFKDKKDPLSACEQEAWMHSLGKNSNLYTLEIPGASPAGVTQRWKHSHEKLYFFRPKDKKVTSGPGPETGLASILKERGPASQELSLGLSLKAPLCELYKSHCREFTQILGAPVRAPGSTLDFKLTEEELAQSNLYHFVWKQRFLEQAELKRTLSLPPIVYLHSIENGKPKSAELENPHMCLDVAPEWIPQFDAANSLSRIWAIRSISSEPTLEKDLDLVLGCPANRAFFWFMSRWSYKLGAGTTPLLEESFRQEFAEFKNKHSGTASDWQDKQVLESIIAELK